MIVCLCHRVSDRDIARAARDGCASFDDLQIDLGVATACGACHDCARSCFEAHGGAASAARDPAAVAAHAAHAVITVHRPAPAAA